MIAKCDVCGEEIILSDMLKTDEGLWMGDKYFQRYRCPNCHAIIEVCFNMTVASVEGVE